jgi:hypothetical protein
MSLYLQKMDRDLVSWHSQREGVVYGKAKPPGTAATKCLIDATDRVLVPRGEACPVRHMMSFLAHHKVTGDISWVKTLGMA